MRFTPRESGGCGFGFDPRALEPFTADGHRKADEHKGRGGNQAPALNRAAQRVAPETGGSARHGRKTTCANAGKCARDNHAGNEEDECCALTEFVGGEQSDRHTSRYREQRQ